jgi:hypothetical protein
MVWCKRCCWQAATLNCHTKSGPLSHPQTKQRVVWLVTWHISSPQGTYWHQSQCQTCAWHVHPYTVSCIHLSMFKHELDQLVKLGVLVHQQESEWTYPSFIILQKNGSVHWISNLSQLKKVIKCKQYPLPSITDIMCKHKFSLYLTFIFTSPSEDKEHHLVNQRFSSFPLGQF